MSTCVLYVDESGDVSNHDVPLKNGQTPIFTLSGVALALEVWRNIDRDYLGLKRKFFDPELKRTTKRHEHYEVKGNTLTAPRNKDSHRRHAYLKEVCDLVLRYEGKLFCVSTIKNPINPTPAISIYTSSLQIMVERFNIYLSEHPIFDKGIIIADSTIRFDWKVAASHMSFIFGSQTGRQLTNIYEAPLFADSRLTSGLQIIDILSSIIFTNHYNYYCRALDGASNYAHMKKHWEKINSLEFRSQHSFDDRIIYGFRVIKHNQ